MTTELEQEFYDTFGIEPEIYYDYKTVIPYLTKTGYWFDKEYLIEMFNNNQEFKVIRVRKNKNYRKITDHKLLQMICILNSIYDCGFKNNTSLASKEVEYLKMEILKYCILHKEQIQTQIQQLFKEQTNEK